MLFKVFYNHYFVLVFLNLFYHFIPFERNSLAPDDYSLLTYKRNSQNYFFDFYERPVELYYFDILFKLIHDNHFLGFIVLLISTTLLILAVYFCIITLIQNKHIAFLISIIYLIFYSKTAIYNNLINAHIIFSSTLYILSFTFFIQFLNTRKNFNIYLSLLLYLVAILWYEIGVFLPLILLLFIKKVPIKIINAYVLLMLLYLAYRMIGLSYFGDTNTNHNTVTFNQMYNSIYSLFNIYLGRSSARIIVYGIYQYFKLPFILIVFFTILNLIIIFILYRYINKLKLNRLIKKIDSTIIIIFILIFFIFLIPNIFHGEIGERHTIISSIGLVSVIIIYLAKFKKIFISVYLITFLIFSIVSQGNSWSQTVSTRINSSVYEYIKKHKSEISSKKVIFDKLSFKKNIHHELIYNKNNVLNTYFGAQVFEDWGINGMITLSINDENYENNIIIINKNYKIDNNKIIFEYNNKKYSIPLNDIFLINYDSVYKDGYLNGNVRK